MHDPDKPLALGTPSQTELDEALYLCATNGIVIAAQVLIERGANADGRTRWNQVTPLHAAASAGHVDMCRLLVENGALLSVRNAFDSTPLDEALVSNRREVGYWLIAHGASTTDVQTHKDTFRFSGVDLYGMTMREAAVHGGYIARLKTLLIEHDPQGPNDHWTNLVELAQVIGKPEVIAQVQALAARLVIDEAMQRGLKNHEEHTPDNLSSQPEAFKP